MTSRSTLPVLCALAFAGAAHADPVPPVSLEVRAGDAPGRLRFTFRNGGADAVEVIADRRLLSLEVPEVAGAPSTARGRRTVRASVARCAFAERPTSNEFSPRVQIAPGQAYSESVDVAELCPRGVPAFPSGAVEVRYGFAAPRTGAASHTRSIVVDDRPDTFPWVRALVLSSDVVAPPIASTDPSDGAMLAVSAAGSSAADAAALRVTATVSNPHVQAAWTTLRPSQFSLVVQTPEGRSVACDVITRLPAGQRELFQRLGARARSTVRLTPAMLCPSGTFSVTGVYRATAAFASSADGAAFGLQRVFTGRVESSPFTLRISRGRLVPLQPRVE